MAKKAAATIETEHNGLPIFKTQVRYTNTGDGLSKAHAVAPFAVEDGEEVVASSVLKHMWTIYENVYSKDDPDLLIGYNKLISFSMRTTALDDREDSRERLDDLQKRIDEAESKRKADAEQAKREARGEFTLDNEAE